MKSAPRLLYDDHRHIGEALTVMESALDPIDLKALQLRLNALDALLEAHLRREVEIFFPALAKRSEYAKVAIQALEHEHDFEREYLHHAEKVFQNPKDDTINIAVLVEDCLAMARLLREHMHREEQLILGPSETWLGVDEDRALFDRMMEIQIPKQGN